MFSHLQWITLGVAGILMSSTSAWADNFEITLNVRSAVKKVQTKQTRISSPPRKIVLNRKPITDKKSAIRKKPQPRLIFNAKPGEQLRVAWRATNSGKSAIITNLLVHYFVVKIDQVGQKDVPKLIKNVAHEGLLSMDFKPKEQATGEFTLKLEKPGSYLVRVETIGMQAQHGHEHYAAIDLLVE